VSEGYDLQKSKKSVHELYPVIKDAHGNVIDGFHRLEADPNWKTETLLDIKTPVDLALARIVANTHRRTISKEERKLQLVTLAEELVKEGMKKDNVLAWISEITTFSFDYLRRMLPAEYKIRPGVGGGAHESVGLSPTQDHEHVYNTGSTQCRICGRELTAPESVKAGIGPVCAGEKSADVSSTPERFPGEHEINQAMGIEPKPQTQEDKAFALLDDLHKRFGEPSISFMNNQLMEKLHIYLPDSDHVIARYKAAKVKGFEKPAVDSAPPFKLVEVTEAESNQLRCPLCGTPQTPRDLEDMIKDYIEELCQEIPIGLANKAGEVLRRHLQ
jgi:hypothetical protein